MPGSNDFIKLRPEMCYKTDRRNIERELYIVSAIDTVHLLGKHLKENEGLVLSIEFVSSF